MAIIKSGKCPLLNNFHECFVSAGREDIRDCNIITLYKNKGDYRGISFLSIMGKLFAQVVLNRFQKLADRVYPQSQCSFRSKQSTIDMIFSLHQLLEKCRAQK